MIVTKDLYTIILKNKCLRGIMTGQEIKVSVDKMEHHYSAVMT